MLFQQNAPHFDFVLKMMWWVLEETAVKVNGKEAGRGRATLSDLSAELAFEGRWKEEKVVGSVSACRKIVTKWSLALGRQRSPVSSRTRLPQHGCRPCGASHRPPTP